MRTTNSTMVMAVTAEMIIDTYSGRPGCGCGCLGNYSQTKAMKTRTLKAMQERAAEVQISIEPSSYTAGPNNEKCVAILALEDDTRYRWAYLRALPAVVAEAAAPMGAQ